MAKVDPETCFTWAATFSHQVKVFSASVHVQPLQVANLLGSAYDTFEAVNPLINACGLDFPLLDKIDGFKPANATSCFTDIETIANIALELKASSAVKDLSDNIIDFLPKIIQAFKAFKQAKADCKIVEKQPATLLASNGFDAKIFKCIEDAQITLKNAKQFVNDYKNSTNMTMVQLFDEAEKVYEDLVGLNQDCGTQKLTNSTLPQIKNVDDLRNCIKDLSQAVQAVENTFTILKDRQFPQLFNATKVVYNAISAHIAQCPKKIQLKSADILACLADGLSIASELKAFVDASKSKNTKDIVIGAYQVLGELSPLAKDCDLDLPIDIPEINPVDLENCAANTDNLVKTIKQLADDISSKKIWNVVHDTTDAIKELKVIISACENQPKLQSASTDIIGCINGAKALYENITTLVDNYKAKDVPQIVVGAYTIVESLQPLINTCGVNFDLHIPVIAFPDLNGCVVDTQSLISGVKSIKDDFSEKNYSKVFDDAAFVLQNLQQIAVICKPTKNLLSDSNNILTCINKSKDIYLNIENLINDSKNKAPINEIVVLAYNIIESLQPLVDDCGIKANLHIPVITFPDLNGCVVDTQGLVNSIKEIRDDIKNKEFAKIFDHVSSSVVYFQQIYKECKPTKNLLSIDALTCLKDAQALYKNVETLIQDSKNKAPINEIVVLSYNIIESLQPLVDDCGIKADLHIPVITFPDLNGCVIDTESLVNTIKAIKDDIQEKKFEEIFTQVATAVTTLKSITAECKPTKNLLRIDVLTCLKDAQALYNNVETLIQDSKNKAPINEIVVLSYNIIESLQPLVDDCGIKANLHIPVITFPDLNGCVVDTEGLVNTIKAIKDDIQEKKFEEIFTQVATAVITLKSIAAECKPTKNLLRIDVLTCLKDAQALYKNVETLIQDSKNKAPINEIVVLSYNIIESLQPLVDDCGIKANLHIPVITFPDLNGCVVDTEGLVNTIKAIKDDIQEKKFEEIFTQVATAVITLKSIAAECKPTKNLLRIDVLTCLKDAQALYNNVETLIQDSKNKAPINEIVVLSYNIIESLQPLVDDCGIKANLHIPVITFPDLNGCVVDTEGLVNTIKAIKDDIQEKKFEEIFTQVATAVTTLKSITAECKPTKNLLRIDVLTCLKDAQALYNNVETLIQDSKNKAPINEIVVLSYNIVESLQPLVDDCGIKADLHIPVINFPDLNGCVVDTEGLVNTIKAIKDDIQEKKFEEIFTQVATAVTTLKSIAAECKPTKNLLRIDVLTCLKDAQALYNNVETLIQDSKSKAPINEIVVLSYNIIESLQPLADICGIKADLHIPVITFPDLNGCVVDTEGLVNTIKTIKDDIQEKKFEEIFTQVATAVTTLKSIAAECKPNKNVLRMDILQCLSTGSKVFKDVKNFVSMTKDHSPVNEIVVNAFNIIKELQPFLTACDIKIDLHIPDIDFNDLNGCIVDGSSIIDDFKTLQKQLEDKDYQSIIGTIQSAIAHVKAVSDECKVHKNSQSTIKDAINLNIKCAKNLVNVAKDSLKVYKELSNDSVDILGKLLAIQGLLKDLQPFCDECGIDIKIPEIPSDSKVITTVECISDVAKAVESLKNIYVDATSINIIKVAKDIKEIYTNVNGAVTVCTQINKSSF
ncbi:hypothetical protein ABPG72_014968 [Tetrahymena utriculariae]